MNSQAIVASAGSGIRAPTAQPLPTAFRLPRSVKSGLGPRPAESESRRRSVQGTAFPLCRDELGAAAAQIGNGR